MSDEEKKCACATELGKFFTLVAAIFLGVLLAILVSAALLKPKCPCRGPMPMPMPRPGIERQIPPMQGHWGIKHHGMNDDGIKKFDKKGVPNSHDFRPQRPERPNIQK